MPLIKYGDEGLLAELRERLGRLEGQDLGSGLGAPDHRCGPEGRPRQGPASVMRGASFSVGRLRN